MKEDFYCSRNTLFKSPLDYTLNSTQGYFFCVQLFGLVQIICASVLASTLAISVSKCHLSGRFGAKQLPAKYLLLYHCHLCTICVFL